MPSYVVLEQEDIAAADKIAYKRDRLALDLDRPPAYGAPANDGSLASLDMNVDGVRGEYAGWLYFRPIYWHRFKRDIKGLPDYEVGDLKINAKTRSKAHYDLIVHPDDPDAWAYLLIRGHLHPTYEIVGWCWGYEAKTRPLTDPTGCRPKAHFIKPSDKEIWKEPYLLLDQVRMRQRLTDLSA